MCSRSMGCEVSLPSIGTRSHSGSMDSLWNIVRRLGGTALSQTLYVLEDGKVVNFVFSVDGLRSFAAEYRNALTFRIDGLAVKVLPLERVLKAKRATGGERK